MNEMLAAWMSSFELAVRTSDYSLGKSLHHDDPIFFGTRTSNSNDATEYQVKQWMKIWPYSRDFKFTELIFCESAENLMTCAMLWENFTTIDGVTHHRTGRATYVFKLLEGRLLAVHSHYSENPA